MTAETTGTGFDLASVRVLYKRVLARGPVPTPADLEQAGNDLQEAFDAVLGQIDGTDVPALMRTRYDTVTGKRDGLGRF